MKRQGHVAEPDHPSASLPTQLGVLIVDEDVLVTTALTAALREFGATVRAIARSYGDALTLIQGEERYDVAFIDLHMDDSASGINLAHRATLLGIAVVAISAGPSIPPALSGLGLLLKPFSTAQIGGLLGSLAPARQGARKN
jgi:CheY-like chemotaxis protein